MHISPDQPYFRLATAGDTGSWQVDCPRDSDVVENFQCEETLVFRYKLKMLKPSEKALALSSKISIRINTLGYISLQFLVQLADSQAVFIEFLCLPEEDVDDQQGTGR